MKSWQDLVAERTRRSAEALALVSERTNRIMRLLRETRRERVL